MRQVILDTETTGLNWRNGNRVVEIGCVEFVERRPTGRTFHTYLKPDCQFEQGAQEVTGLTLEFLADKPRFEEIVDEFLAFIAGAELVIHNAAFDVGFLDHELSRLGPQYGTVSGHASNIEDSLLLARKQFPGQRNSLDALCKRLGVDNGHRQLHGALLDAQILAEVYIALTSGQEEIGFGSADGVDAPVEAVAVQLDASRPRPRVAIEDEDLAAHEARLEKLRKKAGKAVWDQWLVPVDEVAA
ncbi:DNA polymerase III subunit epsilon [Montanilutibacter psychrotolerans]|uniref:DNA polymerase III subunit epsilon n=1 Tax=Montanilutibacter psychrotolerans TaxID=1327343 RepID=A0A3M8SW65_9GAMM|nr:DNA polymerase III subunit epsilon [Lysobacter psychrotolerans]RNF84935.1 DNA polymerase III subunit epsilon [Lysobacter psychrotolerans]